MKKFLSHLWVYILRGLLAITPLLLCAFALQLVYVLIDKRITGMFSGIVDVHFIPGVGVLLLLLVLYLIGLIVSNFIGHQFFKFVENISQRIPVINTIYSVGKQLSQSFSATSQEGGKQTFKKAVLVKLNNGLMIPGFVVNSVIVTKTNEEYLFVMIPTVPNPATGFVFVVKMSEVIDPGWSIEEALKIIFSIGIVSPKNVKLESFLKEMGLQSELPNPPAN